MYVSVVLVIRNARIMTCDPRKPGLAILDRAAISFGNGVVTWIGADKDAPSGPKTIDARGQLVTPGLVDCHTHAIFAGDRANEFAMRADGKSYLEIAQAGGGINATLGPTRKASERALTAQTMARLEAARAGGTTTIEVKSGYDLTVAGELRLLRCIAAIARAPTQRVVPTLLAHLIPPERAGAREAYVAEICGELVPAVAAERLATSVDVYCDEGAFSLAEATAILSAAKRAHLAVRAHVGQFADLGAAEMIAGLGAVSADHLEQISDAGIAALAQASTVAVMLPGAGVQLRLPVPPVGKLRAAGVPFAIATDLNPGSSHCETLPVQMWLATTHYGMTIEEAWLGVTRNAARALGLSGVGTLMVGAPADAVMWSCDEPAHVPYRYGVNLVEHVIVAGA
jgi:imidazolonepropionase